jgi:hypothetical protein
MTKKSLTAKMVGYLENIDSDSTYIIKNGFVMQIEFESKPKYRVIGSRLALLETISESLVLVKSRDLTPIGDGRESFSGFGKSDVIRDAMKIGAYHARSGERAISPLESLKREQEQVKLENRLALEREQAEQAEREHTLEQERLARAERLALLQSRKDDIVKHERLEQEDKSLFSE